MNETVLVMLMSCVKPTIIKWGGGGYKHLKEIDVLFLRCLMFLDRNEIFCHLIVYFTNKQ